MDGFLFNVTAKKMSYICHMSQMSKYAYFTQPISFSSNSTPSASPPKA